MLKPNILLVEDDEILRITVADSLKKAGWPVTTAEDGQEGWDFIKKDNFDIVISDVKLPKKNGIEILKEVKLHHNNTEVIIITAFGKIEDAVDIIKLGAYDYITKPFHTDDLIFRIKKLIDYQILKNNYAMLKNQCGDYSLLNMIGKSKKMQVVFDLTERVSKIDSNILISGESGTGKGLVANVIHLKGKRAKKPFVKVSCAALPETLLESELFGHEKGAFTDAIKKRHGRFEMANGGTIFLDEVGEIPMSIQAKLLRVIQENEFERVGGEDTIKVDVRIISASKKDLEKAIKEGEFREDLYYRLKVIPIHLPPLRERKEDIPLFVDYFITRFNKKFGKLVEISQQAMKCLMDYDFPGNVRELENIIERSVALSTGDAINVQDIVMAVEKDGFISIRDEDIPSLKEVISKSEITHLMKVLEKTNWNKIKAARILGISRKNLWEKLKTYNINQVGSKE
ncbi:MAG: sigma-54-dependent Fis family transcriptional regulator [Nitrospinae bacterium]|nr:sigma-54-dependent Fis family transcriptional regulator [Nitrospinota bacterium]MBI3815214.1 sigma-54-dependent Fis family transcriptional regulator [Nitrospinota bacterium]